MRRKSAPDKPSCPPHYWEIETTCDHDGKFRGVCKKCGVDKYFYNTIEGVKVKDMPPKERERRRQRQIKAWEKWYAKPENKARHREIALKSLKKRRAERKALDI